MQQQVFKDKVIWVTGASSGYGMAMVHAFDQAGARLILSARREDKLHDLAKLLKHAVVLPLDLADISSFKEKTQEALACFGHVDMLFHNGAVAQHAPALQTSLAVEQKIMDIDYFSYTELTRCILPHFLQQGAGHIVVVSGLLAYIHLPGRSSYAAAKAALIAYFGCLRAELMGKNIDVSVLIPGAMQTDLAKKAILADGTPNTPDGQHTAATGCTVDEAAQQTLLALAQRKPQSYIGLEDASYQLWKLTMADPEKGIAMLLNKLKER